MNKRLLREEMIKIIYTSIIHDDIDLSDKDTNIQSIYTDYQLHLDEIDEIIEAHLYNWSINRLNYVDLAIIRYAVYEYLYQDTPKEVMINEAIEMTKKYANLDDDQARKFNNRLLQNIVDGLSDQDG